VVIAVEFKFNPAPGTPEFEITPDNITKSIPVDALSTTWIVRVAPFKSKPDMNVTSASDVPEPKTNALGLNAASPHLNPVPKSTTNGFQEAANPDAPEVNCACPGNAPTDREKLPHVCSTPPESVNPLPVGTPFPGSTCRTPPDTVVLPEYVFSPLNNHCPDPAFTNETASTPLSPNTDRNSLSPVEVPVSVNVRAPVPKKAIEPGFPNTSVAWFTTSDVAMACPVPPDESIVPFPANVNRRSIITEGVCSAIASVAPAPVYCNVPPLNTKLPAAEDDAPIPLAKPPFANRVTANVPPFKTVAPVYVFAPESVTVPLVALRTTVSAPAPPSASTPVKTDDAVLVPLPNDTAAPVAARFRITPAPDGTPNVTSGKSVPEYTVDTAPAPFTSNTPP
jgi:hypothetical protein